ncbi:MAG: cyclic nucleotide-binding domain-containing protein [Campylobacterota bacterium]|nr:cyclic nucleotide-binding domain-containing protein [Campylobacterota bacterium]
MVLIDRYLEKVTRKVQEDIAQLGINDVIKPKTFIGQKEQIFSLYRLFCLLDSSFENELNVKFFYNIVFSLSFYKRYSIDVKSAYRTIESLTNYETNEYRDFEKYFLKVSKKHSELKNIDKILDTKLYYFDKLICDRANNLSTVLQHLSYCGIELLLSTSHYVRKTNKEFSTKIESSYLVDKKSVEFKFNDSDLKYILNTHRDSVEESTTTKDLERLIEVKDKIKLFQNLTPYDIKNVIKNYTFLTYQKNEVVIQQGHRDDAVFFILTGECIVKVDGREVAKIGKNHTVGEFAFLSSEKRSATVITLGNTFILRVELALDRYEYYPESLVKLYKNITQELISKISVINRPMREKI